MKHLIKYWFILFLFTGTSLHAQYSDTLHPKRLYSTLITAGTLYGATMTSLYFLWYKDYPQTGFHWINDNSNWLQIDKVGHATTVYVSSEYMYHALRWSGVENTKAAFYGALTGWGFMATVEFFDGLSTEWGASWGDMIANTAGAGLFMAQQMVWKEQRFRLKFSYFPSNDYAPYRPDLLGENHLQRILKDYNSQTYWLSMNIATFLPSSSKFPKWLNVAAGYGGKGMLGAGSNPTEHNGNPIPTHQRVRQYYFSLDIDWIRIKSKSPFLKTTFKILSFVKIPFPALEYNKENGFVWHWFYF